MLVNDERIYRKRNTAVNSVASRVCTSWRAVKQASCNLILETQVYEPTQGIVRERTLKRATHSSLLVCMCGIVWCTVR